MRAEPHGIAIITRNGHVVELESGRKRQIDPQYDGYRGRSEKKRDEALLYFWFDTTGMLIPEVS